MHPRSVLAPALGAFALATTFAALFVPLGPLTRVLAQALRTTMDVAEVRPGMRGYGLTVFRGTTPERFEVEVIDVLHRFRPDQDLIVIRTRHPTLELAAAVGGMSGSPIYLEDRLVGAYAYGWNFGREPIAGVTPISNMLAEIDRPYRPDSFPGAVPLDGGRPATRARARRRAQTTPYLGGVHEGAFAHAREPVPSSPSSTLVPCTTPMLVGGLEPSAVAMLAQAVAPFGLDVLQAGGAGARTPVEGARFVDGGALAVDLARGDISSHAVGTVTLVRGQRLVAFGHPMLEAGEPGLPTSVARVIHVLASYQRSFKMAEPVAPLGTMIHDRQSAVVIDQTIAPTMIPVRLRLRGVPPGHREEWNFEVASHRALTPMLIASSIQSAVKSVSSDFAHVMFEATSRVWLQGRQDAIEVVDRGHSSSGPSQSSALSQIRAFDLLEMAYANPFEETRPSRIEVDLSIRFAHDTTEIVDASVESTEVDPGERVRVRAVLRPFGQPERVSLIDVDIPESAAGQSLQLLLQPGTEVENERPEPRSLDDIVDMVKQRHGSTELVVSTRLGARGLRMAGHVVSNLPASALDALQRTADSARSHPFVTHRRLVIPMNSVLTGGARVDIAVRRTPRSDALDRGVTRP